MPFHVPPATDERSALHGYLAQQQDAFRAVSFGLTDDQAGLTPTASALSVGALVKHATHVQRSWLAGALAAPALPTDDRPFAERVAEREDALRWLESDTWEEVYAAFDEVSAAVLEAVDTLDLDAEYPVGPAPWNPPDVTAWSMRWVWLHLIEELARHAGHADIIREAVDGATMYALVAGREGMEPTPWLTPWRPEGQDAPI